MGRSKGWQLIWQLAGILGVDPGPLTLRELVWMAEARIKQQWAHTASLMALLANAHRDPKKGRAFKPADFDPTRKLAPSPAWRELPKADVSILKQVFIRQRA